jgi:hypothetical protein
MELAERCTNMAEPTLLHKPLDEPMIDIPSWMLDGMENSRRVWHILVYKPVNKINLSSNDDEFMAFIMDGGKDGN